MFSQATGPVIQTSHHSQRSVSVLALAGLFTFGCIGAIEPLPKATVSASPVARPFSVSCVAEGSGAGKRDY